MPAAFRYLSLSFVFVTASLASCAVGPDYRRPAAVAFVAPNSTLERSSERDLDELATWWREFHDPVLNELMDRALTGNLDLEQAAARIDQAGATLSLARAAFFPSGQVEASASRERQSLAAPPALFLKDLPSGYPRIQNNFLLEGSASWEIDLFGGTRRANEGARAEFAAVHADAQATRVIVIGSVAESYLMLRQAQAQRVLIEAGLTLQRRDAELNELLMSRGIVAISDNEKIRAALEAEETRLPALLAVESALANAIDVLLGDAVGTHQAALATPFPVIPSVELIPSTNHLIDPLRNRPDVIAAEAHVRAANARIGQSIAEYYPKISLTGLIGVASLTTGALFSNEGVEASGSAGLRWRLFDFQRIDAEIKQAKGGLRGQVAAYRSAVLNAARDVEDAETQVGATTQVVQQRQNALEARARAQQAALHSFEHGASSEKDRIESDRLVVIAKLDLVAARTGQTQAIIRLYRALGSGWTVSDFRARSSYGARTPSESSATSEISSLTSRGT